MKTQDVFPNRFVKAEDLVNDKIVTIESVVIESVYNPGEHVAKDHPIVYFHNATKGMLLNKTNWNSIAELYGDDTDGWIGKKVVLFAKEVSTPDGPQPAVRIKAVGEK